MSTELSHAPESLDRSEVNRAQFTLALDEFALARGLNLAAGSQEASLALANATLSQTDDETAQNLKTEGYTDMRRSYDLLEGLGTDLDNAPLPGCTVGIELAILSEEDCEGVLHTLDLVRKSQQEWGQEVEVILWANAGYGPEEDVEDFKHKAQAAYDTLRENLAATPQDGLQIRTALEVLPKEGRHLEIIPVNEAAMSRMRSHELDAAVILAEERGYGFDHPHVWLDADTTVISPNALQEISGAVRRFDGLTICPNLQFTTEWVGDTPLEEMDDATKAVAINEIQRRQLQKQQLEAGVTPASYIAEAGFAFSYGAYLRSGGIDTSYITEKNESASLLRRMLLRSYQTYRGEGVIPEPLLPNGGFEGWDDSPPLTKRLASVRIGVSARGIRAAVLRDGVDVLRADYKENYELYSHRPPERHDLAAQVRGDDLTDVLAYNRKLYLESADPERDEQSEQRARRMGHLVNRYFGNN